AGPARMSPRAPAAPTGRRTGAAGTAPRCTPPKSPSPATPAPGSTPAPIRAPTAPANSAGIGAPPAKTSTPSATSSPGAAMTTISTTTDAYASALAQFQAELPAVEKSNAYVAQRETKEGQKNNYRVK